MGFGEVLPEAGARVLWNSDWEPGPLRVLGPGRLPGRVQAYNGRLHSNLQEKILNWDCHRGGQEQGHSAGNNQESQDRNFDLEIFGFSENQDLEF